MLTGGAARVIRPPHPASPDMTGGCASPHHCLPRDGLIDAVADALGDLRGSAAPVAIALSGGGDSMALLDLYARLARSDCGWPPDSVIRSPT